MPVMLTLRAVEPRWTTAAKSVLAHSIDSTLLDSLVARKTREVVAGEIDDRLARGELWFGTRGANDDWNRSKVGGLALVQWCSERLW